MKSRSDKDIEAAETSNQLIHDHRVSKDIDRKNDPNREYYFKLLFCFIGLQVSYILWGITQENLMTAEYKLGKFKSSSFCVFANRLLALLIAFAIVAFRSVNQNQHDPKQKVVKDVPFYYYAPSSLSNTISSWAQYESLKYVSFPVQVLSKSCKVIPVMLVSYMIRLASESRRYLPLLLFHRWESFSIERTIL